MACPPPPLECKLPESRDVSPSYREQALDKYLWICGLIEGNRESLRDSKEGL